MLLNERFAREQARGVRIGTHPAVNQVEVLSGLKVDDSVILSDMSAWDAFDRVRLK